jgi:hypothetical protein
LQNGLLFEKFNAGTHATSRLPLSVMSKVSKLGQKLHKPKTSFSTQVLPDLKDLKSHMVRKKVVDTYSDYLKLGASYEN